MAYAEVRVLGARYPQNYFDIKLTCDTLLLMTMKEAIGTRKPRTSDGSMLSRDLEELTMANDFVITQFTAYHWRITHPDYPEFCYDIWPTANKIRMSGKGYHLAEVYTSLYEWVMEAKRHYE